MFKVTVEEFNQAVINAMGWCVECQDFVNEGSVEPDANSLRCECCGKLLVVGTNVALEYHFITTLDENGEPS